MPEQQEPPVREFADRATLWLLESSENLRGLMQIVAREIADRLDFSRAERINRSFIPDDLQKQEADLLYRVPFRDGTGEILVYLLLEHQSRPDREMGLRLLSYMVQIWDGQRRRWRDARTPVSRRKLHPIIPVVFYTGKRRWTTPLSLDALMDLVGPLTGFVPRHETLFLSLAETPPDRLTGSAVAWALRALQAAEETCEGLAAVLSEAVAYLDSLPEEAQAEWRRAIQYLLLLIRHKRKPEEQEPLQSVVFEAAKRRRKEAREMAMTGAQWLEEKGRREVLLEQLEFKFGPLPAEITAKIQALTGRRITDLAKRVLTAQTLDDLGLTQQ